MPSPFAYSNKHVGLAASVLACSDTLLRERLAKAFIEHLSLVSDDDVPDHLLGDLTRIRSAVLDDSMSTTGEDSITPRVTAMAQDTATHLASDILDLAMKCEVAAARLEGTK